MSLTKRKHTHTHTVALKEMYFTSGLLLHDYTYPHGPMDELKMQLEEKYV